jgi:hypothetical protein
MMLKESTDGDSDEQAVQTDTGTDTGTESSISFPTNPDAGDADSDEQTDAGDCPKCGGPTDALDAGETFRTEGGATFRTESSDEWCANCEGVVTADGEVLI